MGTRRRFGPWVCMVVVAAVFAAVVPAAPAEAAFYPPKFVRSIGGTGRAGVYAWGAQHNPVSNEVVVGDYLNYQIRRYDLNGNEVGSFYRSNPNGQPYSLAVDPTDGDIYVPEIADGSESGVYAKYDRFGNFMFSFTIGAQYNAWIATDSTGKLYVSDSHYWNDSGSNPPRIRVYTVNDATQTASQTANWSINVSGMQVPRAYGIDVAGGTVYISDTINKVVHKWSTSGSYQGSFGSAAVFGGDVRGVTVDEAHGWVYVVDASNSEVDKFTTSGTYLGAIGTEGEGDGQFSGPRQPTVDGAGNLWVTDYGNYRVQKFDQTGAFLLAAPHPARHPGDALLAQPRDVDVNPNTGEVWVADSWNQRVQKFTSDGTFLGTWGQRGNGLYGFNYPRGVGVDPATNRVYVSSERGHYVQAFEPDMLSGAFTLGTPGVDSANTNYLRWPNDVEFHNGTAIVSDRVSGYVKGFSTTTGLETGRISRNNWGIAVDPATGNVFVVNPSNDRIYKYSAYNGSQVAYWGSTGSGNGQFQYPKDAVVCGGILFVTDDQLSRVQAFTLSGSYLGKWGGAGSGPHQMRNPTGIACGPNGYLYVADAGNDRVLVYDPNQAKPAYESTKPTVTVATPTENQTLSAAVPVNGAATDNAGIANVEISVKDNGTGLWWNTTNDTWTSTQSWGLAALNGAATTSMTFNWSFVGGTYGHTYQAQVRARDVSSNVSTLKTVNFAVDVPPPPDTTPPTATVTMPVAGQQFPAGAVPLSGTASDDRGVASAKVGIKDAGTSQWWNGSGWQAGFVWLDANVAGPGATATTWSYAWTPPAPGSYAMTLRVDDTSANTTGTLPQVAFTTGSTSDTTAPNGLLTTPTQNQSIPLAQIPFSGTATDDVAVGAVKVAIRNNSTLQWWTGSGWGAFTWLTTSLATPYLTSTNWSYAWTPPATGSYSVQVRADDTSGNVDPSKPWVTFSVTDPLPPDNTPPSGVVTAPQAGQTVPLGTVNVAGTASDDRGVAAVEVALQDTGSGQWWNGSGWQAGVAWLDAAVAGTSETSKTWSYAWPAPAPAAYGVTVRVEDTSANLSTPPANVPFTVSPADSTPPDSTVVSPTEGQSFPFTAPIAVSGTATDDVGVGAVKVAIRDNSSLQWWTGAGWGSATWLDATLTSPGMTSTPWSFTWTPPAAGNYGIQVRTDDTSANTDPTKPWVNVVVTPDTTAPTGSVTAPQAGQIFPLGTVNLAGTAADETAIAGAAVAVQDTVSGQWWDGAAWQPAQTWLTAQLSGPSPTSKTWSYAWAAPSGGSYAATVRIQDSSANASTPPAATPFSVTSGPDTTPANGTVTVPTGNQAFPPGPVTFSGNATDDVGVGAVKVAIRNAATLQWWTGTGWGVFTWLDAPLAAPGMTVSGWSYTWTPPAPGSYSLQVRAGDTSGNVDPTKPWVNFSTT